MTPPSPHITSDLPVRTRSSSSLGFRTLLDKFQRPKSSPRNTAPTAHPLASSTSLTLPSRSLLSEAQSHRRAASTSVTLATTRTHIPQGKVHQQGGTRTDSASSVNNTPASKWQAVEAMWKREAWSLKGPHRDCLLGAVCLNITDPLEDLTANKLRLISRGMKDRPSQYPNTQSPSRQRLHSAPLSHESKSRTTVSQDLTPHPLKSPTSNSSLVINRPPPPKRRQAQQGEQQMSRAHCHPAPAKSSSCTLPVPMKEPLNDVPRQATQHTGPRVRTTEIPRLPKSRSPTMSPHTTAAGLPPSRPAWR